MRILPGILAGQDFSVILKGDRSLSKRPMQRIAAPMKKMGAEVVGVNNEQRTTNDEIYPPLKIHGGRLKSIKYKSKIASAQVKSCILLAGLFAKGVTSVSEPVKSRDHTERMLRIFGCKIYNETLKGKFPHAGTQPLGCRVSLKGPAKLTSPGIIEIPGDISSAAFFIIAGCILPDTKIIIKNVGLNPTRTGVLDILKKMAADIRITIHHSPFTIHEPIGDIVVRSSKLKGVAISPREVARAIDEIPIIMVAACFAKGTTVIKGIGELRVKETDRIKSMVTNLRKMGADIRLKASLDFARDRQGSRLKAKKSLQPKGEFIIINGGKPLGGARVSSYGDHRTAMSMLIADLACKGKLTVTGLDCINKSFPNFLHTLNRLAH